MLREIYDPIREDLARVEETLSGLIKSAGSTVAETVPRILNAGGKRLRPALLLLSARACHYTGARSIHLAAAMELLHTASLVHDDIVDSGILRRGVPTINAGSGDRVSVLVGDRLYAIVLTILAEYGDKEIIRTVAKTANSMTEGELSEVVTRDDMDTAENKYLSIIRGKTASLTSCCCRLGAILGRDGNGQLDALTDYGTNLGMAFQITDDVIDITGSDQKEGKLLAGSIREGNLTLPLAYTVSVADDSDRHWMEETFKARRVNKTTIARMRETVDRYGGIKHSLHKAMNYGRACTVSLSALGASDFRGSLAALSDYVVGRAG